MPAKSGKQFRYMAGVMSGSINPGKSGPSRSVAKEFVDKTPSNKRKRFASNLRNSNKKSSSGY